MRRQKETDIDAIDYLDDGSPIKLHVDLDIEKGEAVFDFRYVFLIELLAIYLFFNLSTICHFSLFFYTIFML